MKKNISKCESRTKNVIKNSFFALISKVGILVLQFICRTVFIKMLGSTYLGLNGLFTNILTVLSFAELGLGNAIVYNMYKPLSNKNFDEVSSLLKMYKKCYNIIALFIFGAGIMCIPFLKNLIGNVPNVKESIYFIYILFLLQSVSSYILNYRRSLLFADQKEYLCSNADLISEIIASVLKIMVLVLWRNYILFLLIQISRNLVANLILFFKSRKMYNNVDEKSAANLSKDKKKKIFGNIKSLMLYKVSSTINSGTDNIIITKIVGLAAVGMASNYSLLIGAINQILQKIMGSFTASVGNLNAKDSVENREKVFNTLTFLVTWMFGFFSIMLVIFLNPFIKIWIGENYILDIKVIFALVLEFFVCGTQYAGYNFAITTSLFKKAKWGALTSSILNVILSVVLGYKFGIFGIFLATGLSRLFAQTWLDPYLVFKYEFKKSSKNYFIKYIRNFLIVLFNMSICYIIFSKIRMNSIGVVFVYCVICAFVSNLIFLISFFKTKEFKDLMDRIKFLILRKNNC